MTPLPPPSVPGNDVHAELIAVVRRQQRVIELLRDQVAAVVVTSAELTAALETERSER